MALPSVFQSLEQDYPSPALVTKDRAAEVAAIKREIADQLGHQCAECLTDAVVARWLNRRGQYDQLLEVQEHVAAADRLKYDVHALETGHRSEVATPELVDQREIRNEFELLSRALGMDKLVAKLVEIDRDLPADAVGLDVAEQEIDLRDELILEEPQLTIESASPLAKQAPIARFKAQVQDDEIDHAAAVEQEVRSIHASSPAPELEGDAEPEFAAEAKAEPVDVDREEVGADFAPEAESIGIDQVAANNAEAEQDFAQWENELVDQPRDVTEYEADIEGLEEQSTLDGAEFETAAVEQPVVAVADLEVRGLDLEAAQEFAVEEAAVETPEFEDVDLRQQAADLEVAEPDLDVASPEVAEPDLDVASLEVAEPDLDVASLEVAEPDLENPEPGLEVADLKINDLEVADLQVAEPEVVGLETRERELDDFALWEQELAGAEPELVAVVEPDLELPEDLTAAYRRLEDQAVQSLSDVQTIKEAQGMLEAIKLDQSEAIRRMNIVAPQIQNDRLVPILRSEEKEAWEDDIPPLPSFDIEEGVLTKSSFRKVRGQGPKIVWSNPVADEERKRRRLINVATISQRPTKAVEEKSEAKREIVESGCKGCAGGGACCPSAVVEVRGRMIANDPSLANKATLSTPADDAGSIGHSFGHA